MYPIRKQKKRMKYRVWMMVIWVAATLDVMGMTVYEGETADGISSGWRFTFPVDRGISVGHANIPDTVQPYEMFIPRRYLTKEFLLGKIEQAEDTAFVEISHRYTPYKLRLLKETYRAFIRMYEAARQDGIELKIISAARTYQAQSLHWNAKWKRLEKQEAFTSDLEKTRQILLYCSLPGISRHHWGTEIDLNSLEPSYFDTPTGEKVYAWLQQNAAQYGFYQPYTSRTSPNRATGFCEEKWHWSYRPLSAPFLVKYKELVTPDDIAGFTGDNTVKELNLVEWIDAVNPRLILPFPYGIPRVKPPFSVREFLLPAVSPPKQIVL